MKCPHCGRELQDNETFCPGCGWRAERNDDQLNTGNPQNMNMNEDKYTEFPPFPDDWGKPQPRGWKVVRALVAVFMFIFLMFGCQSCVMSGYMTSLVMQEGVDPAMLDEDAVISLTERVIRATTEKTVIILLIANLLTILIICLLFHLRKKDPVREMKVLSVNPLRIPTFALFGAALNVFVSITLSMIPLPESVLESFDAQYSSLYGGTSIWVEILSVAVVAGVTEELIYRGLAMSRLKPTMGTAGAVIVSSFLFGISHGTPIAVVYAAVLGVVFALLYNAFDSVVPTIVCHVCFNATSYVLALVPEDQSVLLLGLYVLSVGAILWCTYRMFVRRPTFNDMITDVHCRIKPINEEEYRILGRVHELQSSGKLDENTLEEMESLQKQWEENRKRNKKKKKK